jgi:hypothetical protein
VKLLAKGAPVMKRPRLLPILILPLVAGALPGNFAPASGSNASPLRRATLAFRDDPATKKKVPPKDAPPEQREQIIRRLHGEFEGALSNLEKQNTGTTTRALQQKILEDLDRLIDPPNTKDNPPPAKQPNNPEAPKSPNTGQGVKKNAGPSAKDQEASAAPSTNEKAAGKPTDAELKNTPGKRPDGFWGERRWQERQALDAYSSDRFMRRYEELLRQYYRGIAEEKQRRTAD